MRKTPATLDRLPPHDQEAEQGVLGCQLIAPNECILEAQLALKGEASAYYDLRHREIQSVLFDMWDERVPVDLITVQSRLADRGLLEQIGGVAYLSRLQDSVPSAANLPAYLATVTEKRRLRQALATAMNFVSAVYDAAEPPDQLLENFEREVMAVRTLKGDGEMRSAKQLVLDALQDIETMFAAQGKVTGMTTGFSDIDRETDGLHNGELTLIASFPSVGKTSLAMNIVEHVTLDLGLPVGVFSAEMTARSLVLREICSQGRVNLRNVRDGRINEADFANIQRAAGKISTSKLHIDDISDLTTGQIRAKARRMVQQFGVKLIVADYAQLFSSPEAENRTNEIDQVGKAFKKVAKELNIPVILLSQLTDDQKGGVRLKGATALGEDADNYHLLKRPPPEEGVVISNDSEAVDFWIKKQRNGPREVCIRLTFLKGFTRFEQARRPVPEMDNYADR